MHSESRRSHVRKLLYTDLAVFRPRARLTVRSVYVLRGAIVRQTLLIADSAFRNPNKFTLPDSRQQAYHMEGTVLPERTKTERQNRNTVESLEQTGSNATCSISRESIMWSHDTSKIHYICVTRKTKSVAVTFEPRNLMQAKKSFHR